MNRLHAYLLTRARIHRRQRTRRYRTRQLLTTGWGLAALLTSAIVVAVLILAWQYSRLTHDLPSIELIPRQLNAQSELFTRPTRLLDRSGTHILLDLVTPGVQRKYMRIGGVGERVSQDFVTAIIAITEPGFATSGGVRYDTWKPDDHPTIAQKLVFEMLLSQEQPTLRRAIREKLLAAQLMNRYGRDRVLEWYVNSLYFGHLAYGVEAGAQTYFGKSSSTLTLPESAILAGVALAPAINPWDSAAGAETLKQEVLKVMTLHGRITPAVFNAAVRVQVDIQPDQPESFGQMAAFTRAALAQLELEMGKSRIERGGLTIQTTLDYGLQEDFNCIIKTQLESLEGKKVDLVKQARECPASRLLPLLPPGDAIPPGRLAAGAMAADPQTGQILAYTGEISSREVLPSFRSNPIGSLVTPLVYLNSYSQGYSPASLVWDAPENGATTPGASINPDGAFHGAVSIRRAMANDYLVPVIRIIQQTGWHGFLRLARTMGLVINQPEEPEAVFTQHARLDEIIRAYSILAAGGNRNGITLGEGDYPSNNFVLKIWDENGAVVVDHTAPDSIPIISSPLAYLVTQPLADDISRQPSMGFPTVLQLGTTTAAKVGIDPAKLHAWTVGYTPERIVGVWLGPSRGTVASPTVDYRWSAGIWRAAMDRALEGSGAQAIQPPPGITSMKVCYPSGELPAGDCPVTVDEVFMDGTEPNSPDTLYHRLTINRETGRLATVFTPPELAQEKVFMDVPVQFTDWARSAGLTIPPRDYDVIRNTNQDPAVHFTTPAMFSYVRGMVQLTGSASSADFAVYRIQIGEGLNPRSWRQVGQDGHTPVIEGWLADLDTSGMNGLYVLRLQVIDTQNRIKTAYLQFTVDNTAPVAEIIYPANGQTIRLADTPVLLIRLKAADAIALAKVQILLDGKLLTDLDTPPYAYAWEAKFGSHTLQAIAIDSVGNTYTGQTINISVK